MSAPWHHAASFFASNSAVAAAQFVAAACIARWLGPDLQGQLAVLMLYPLLGARLSEMGLRQAAARVVGQNPARSADVRRTIFVLWLFTGAVGAGLIALLLRFGPQGDDLAMTSILLLAVLLPLLSWGSYAGGIFLGLGAIGRYTLSRWAPAVLSAALALLAWRLVVPDVTVAVAIKVIPAIVGLVLVWHLLRRDRLSHQEQGHYAPDIAKRLILDGLVFGIVLFASFLLQRAAVVVLEWTATHREVGFFHVALQSALVLGQFATAFGLVRLSQESRSTEAVDIEAIKRDGRRCLLLCIPVAVVGWLAAPILFSLAYGPEYHHAVPAFRALLPGVVIITAQRIGAMALIGAGRPKQVLPSVVVGLVVALPLMVWWGSEAGATGAAWALSVAYAASAAVFVFTLSRLRGRQ